VDEAVDDVDELVDDGLLEVVEWVDDVCLVDVVLVVVWVLECVVEVEVGVQVDVGLVLVFSCVVVVCVVLDVVVSAPPPPPPELPNDQEPWSSPTPRLAKDENKPEEKSRPPNPHPIHSSTMVADWVFPLMVILTVSPQYFPPSNCCAFKATM